MYNYSNKYIKKTLYPLDLKEIKKLEIYKRLPYGLGKSKLDKNELILLIIEYVNICKYIEDFEEKLIKNNYDPTDYDLKKIKKFCKIEIKKNKNNKVEQKEIKKVKKSILKRILEKIKMKK